MTRQRLWPGGASTPPEAPLHAAYQATGSTVTPAAGTATHDAGHVVQQYAPIDLDPRARAVLDVLAFYANDQLFALVPLRRIAELIGCSSLSPGRSATVRLEDAECLVVYPGKRRADGRLGVTGYQITLGPWKDLWRPPGVVRASPRETFIKRSSAMPERRAALAEKLVIARRREAQARTGARTGAEMERALVGSGARTGSAHRERAQEVLRTSIGGARKEAPPTWLLSELPPPLSPEATRANAERARAALKREQE